MARLHRLLPFDYAVLNLARRPGRLSAGRRPAERVFRLRQTAGGR